MELLDTVFQAADGCYKVGYCLIQLITGCICVVQNYFGLCQSILQSFCTFFCINGKIFACPGIIQHLQGCFYRSRCFSRFDLKGYRFAVNGIGFSGTRKLINCPDQNGGFSLFLCMAGSAHWIVRDRCSRQLFHRQVYTFDFCFSSCVSRCVDHHTAFAARCQCIVIFSRQNFI